MVKHTFGHLLVAWNGGDEQLCVWEGHLRVWELKDVRNVVCKHKYKQEADRLQRECQRRVTKNS